MRHELSINIKVIFASGDAQSRDVDRNVKHAEEREGKHSRDRIS